MHKTNVSNFGIARLRRYCKCNYLFISTLAQVSMGKQCTQKSSVLRFGDGLVQLHAANVNMQYGKAALVSRSAPQLSFRYLAEMESVTVSYVLQKQRSIQNSTTGMPCLMARRIADGSDECTIRNKEPDVDDQHPHLVQSSTVESTEHNQIARFRLRQCGQPPPGRVSGGLQIARLQAHSLRLLPPQSLANVPAPPPLAQGWNVFCGDRTHMLIGMVSRRTRGSEW